MITYLQKLRDERDSLSATSTGILESAAKEDRQVSETEKASVQQMATRCAEIDTELRTFSEQYEAQRAYAVLRDKLSDVDEAPKRELAKRSNAEIETRDAGSWGKLFVDSDAFKTYDGHGSTPRVSVPGLFTRAPIDTTGDWGFNKFPYVWNQPQPVTTTPLLDAVGKVSTNSLVVQWVSSGKPTDAAVVAEGQPKPEADLTITTDTGALQTYAHWKGVTRQALADIPQIQSIIETQLRTGIFQKLEADIAAALAASTGAGGITDLVTVAGTDVLSALRSGIATVQSQGFPNANTVLCNPMDWADLDLAVMEKTNNGPNASSAFWGLKPIASAAIPANTYYVGDLSTAVTLFTMAQAAVYMSDSHSDFFVRNILVILAEVMALGLVTQPAALVRWVYTPGATQSAARSE